MNKELKFTIPARGSQEFTFQTGVDQIAITNANGYDGDVTIVTREITKTKSGDIVSFDDGADAPFADLKVNIEAVQSGSGDPSPTNVRPISGWTGANVTRTGFNAWDEEWEVGGIAISDGQNINLNGAIRAKNYNPCLPNIAYFFIAPTSSKFVFWYDSNKEYISNKYIETNTIITSPANARYFRLRIDNYYSTTATYNHDICINISDPAKNGTYEPGHVVTYDITFPTEAGTVYGGQLDVLNCLLTVTHTVATLTKESTWQQGVGQTAGGFNRFYTSPVPTMKGGSGMLDGMCDKLPIARITSTIPCVVLGYSNNNYIQVLSNASDVTEFKEELNNTFGNELNVVYPLATPITYQLTPTEVRSLLGINNVWANCGPVNVRYFVQSTQPLIDYIDEKPPVFFDAQEDLSTYDISLVGATSTDVKNCLLANKNANIIIRVKRYSTIMLYHLREYSPNYFADFASHATIFDAEGTKSMRIDYLRLDLTQETSNFTDDYIILPTT